MWGANTQETSLFSRACSGGYGEQQLRVHHFGELSLEFFTVFRVRCIRGTNLLLVIHKGFV